MLSKDDNDLLTQTASGTPMGDLIRRYWVPVVASSEVTAGTRTKRVQILGESLVVFRTQEGVPGLVGEHCPHRGASLYLGRIEADGIRCSYHGWKFGLDGRCTEMPNEPTETDFGSKVCHRAYPCVERGGVVWSCMTPLPQLPPFPELEWTHLPANQVLISKRVQDSNWVQALEGGIDSSHISFLHSPLDSADASIAREIDQSGFGVGTALQTGDRAPRVESVDTDYGVMIGARRNHADGSWYWRVTQFLMPFYAIPPTEIDGRIVQSHIWVPMDDTHVVHWVVTWHTERALAATEIAAQAEGKGAHVTHYAPPTPEPYGDVRTAADRHNDYFMDWKAHRMRMFFGVPGFGMQDKAIQESQGSIADRTKEHLGASDLGIIKVRMRLMNAARDLSINGTSPPGLEARGFYVRSGAFILPAGASWIAAAKELNICPKL